MLLRLFYRALPSIVLAAGSVLIADSGEAEEALRERAAPVPVQLAQAPACSGSEVIRGGQRLLELADGTTATVAPMRVDLDGAERAYHRDGFDGGAILRLCNAGQVYLPDGTFYRGSESNTTCTGRFLDDLARIEAAGWDDPNVGAVRWNGILAEGVAEIAGQSIVGVRPVYNGESRAYVSPTALADPAFPPEDQARYVDSLTVPYAAVGPESGIALGTLGVAWRINGCAPGRTCDPVPFVVGDLGPGVGEGSLWMTRAINGLKTGVPIERANRFAGAISGSHVLWVFFGGTPLDPPYDAINVKESADIAFIAWGGRERLQACRDAKLPVAND
ncbi:MAG: hypothetical protein RIC87_10870 [Kiloniellales bacterium]